MQRSVARCAEQTMRSTILRSELKQPLPSENHALPETLGQGGGAKAAKLTEPFAVRQKIQKIQLPNPAQDRWLSLEHR